MKSNLNILIDNSSYDLLNSGDIAMAKVCIERLQKNAPNASLKMITQANDILTYISPIAQPVNLFIKRKAWSQKRNIFGPIYKLIPRVFHPNLERVENNIRLTYPKLMTRWMYHRLRKNPKNAELIKQYIQHIDEADVAVASGGGFMTDAFEDHAINILELLYLVKRQGKPVAMFGQGVGPVTSPKLLATMKKVLPTLDMICIRESISGLQLLLDLGVSKERIVITGDDAIELSKAARKTALGNKLGFNVRVANYANIDITQDKSVGNIINDFSSSHNTSSIAIPISWYPHEKDLEKINEILNIANHNEQLSFQNIEGLMRQVAECRLIVTGSYHAGVFALSQGIPVIGLARSQYYVDKFNGLSGMFPSGVQVICLDKSSWQADLKEALRYAWDNADALRENLISLADNQIELSKKAYSDFFKLINNQ
ncbi:polysaccharide pyruvyl transferase family protein [Methylophaga pinxianii]|uniref:polysaccharide pyruvyl transferase family protein n=1 Tax=Methylophaga pinxianii TaxID=2881052 RepID=UPI001CF4F243|nr:polysaccharide pyruvyl transferase family protein [Methylophaga pinxianii]MCB2425875.1 polysaccharide pyruvyl transferase family protein [Methylophaga pinxianii]UPH45115.1 polysaccharide pyruvyl transferase family protein [Methylophaga pinxianii]